ncbi:MAG: hypothetical protein FRX49_10234 [Trebouxia sp. A1-2]|nr:MAG: hypothetical protein FRX49_10234 [Trebouxia sp. A1-2]
MLSIGPLPLPVLVERLRAKPGGMSGSPGAPRTPPRLPKPGGMSGSPGASRTPPRLPRPGGMSGSPGASRTSPRLPKPEGISGSRAWLSRVKTLERALGSSEGVAELEGPLLLTAQQRDISAPAGDGPALAQQKTGQKGGWEGGEWRVFFGHGGQPLLEIGELFLSRRQASAPLGKLLLQLG